MKPTLKVIITVSILYFSFQPVPIANAATRFNGFSAQAAPGRPAALCLPGVYAYDPGDCTPAGSSAYMTRMAQEGIHLPLAPLSYAKIDPALGDTEVHYAEVRNMPAPVYSSVDDAVAGAKKGSGSQLNGNFVFVSYTDLQEVKGKKLYQIGPNQWITGNYLTRLGIIPPSQGLTFTSTPATPFAWVLTYFTQNGYLESKRTPGTENNDYTGRRYNLYDIVPVFSERKIGEDVWYQIGPEEWAPAKYVARVKPNTTPPAGVSGDRWIEVNLFDQTLAVYDKRQLIFATLIASGAEPMWTRPGVFQIFEEHEAAPMSGALESGSGDAYYLEDVPWTMYFDGARALHGAYWRAKMGFPQSHGCVNLTVGDAHWLYNWAKMGDWVYVWDPSGKTPTDPSMFTSGGY